MSQSVLVIDSPSDNLLIDYYVNVLYTQPILNSDSQHNESYRTKPFEE
jgi:hypothetical protein